MKKKFILGLASVAAISIVPVSMTLASRGTDDLDDQLDQISQEDHRQDNQNALAPTVNEDDDAKVDDDDDVTPTGSETFTLDQAKAKANETLPGKTFEKAELENEDGVVVWSIRFTDGSRVDVSSVDGTVTRVKDKAVSDNDQDEDDDEDEDNDDSSRSGSNSDDD